MRALYLANAMSLPSVNPNPFARFALAATPTAAADSISRGASSLHAAPSRPVHSSAAKKIRTVLGSKPGDGQEPPKGLLEKYRSPGEPEWPLRLIIVGHNPSEKAWELGHYYANPSNRMWKLLSAAGIVPARFVASNDDDCPIQCGVGFTDVGFSHPGTVSGKFKRTELHAWRQDFYDRLSAHTERAAATIARVTAVTANAAPSAAGAATAATTTTAVKTEPASTTMADRTAHDATVTGCFEDGFPKVVAFAGKRQWEELFFDASAQAKAQTKGGKSGQFQFGLQPAALRPSGWPFPSQATEVFVLPSSSGAAAMTNEAREGPYRALGIYMLQTGRWDRRRSVKVEASSRGPASGGVDAKMA